MSAKSAKMSRLGANPLDAMIPKAAPKAARANDAASPLKKDGRELAEEGSTKKPSTFHVDIELLAEVRGAVVACAAPPLRLTMTDFIDRALRTELARLRKEQNGGKPFAPVLGLLRSGRRIGG